jgi:large subunit ribosomal protein L15
MKTLGNLQPSKGSNTKKKRVGRGVGSGLGKTAGRGHKGQKARKSSDVPAGFEGGQMPLYRRTPKRGFNNIFRVNYEVVNLADLSELKAGSSVTAVELSKMGLVKNKSSKVKLLGQGTVGQSLNVTVDRASATAVAAIEKAGGKITVTNPVVPVKKKASKKKK